MKKCVYCQSIISDDARFCAQCGTEQPIPSVESTENMERQPDGQMPVTWSKKKLGIIACIIFGVLFIGIAASAMRSGSASKGRAAKYVANSAKIQKLSDDTVIAFSDERLLADVKTMTGVTSRDITYGDVKNITELATRDQSTYENISTLQYFTSLKRLYISITGISNLNELAGLENLESLYITGMELDDISALGNLKNLKSVGIEANSLCLIDGIKDLPMLTEMSIHAGSTLKIRNMSGLPSLSHLEIDAGIKDLSGLTELTGLKSLSVWSGMLETFAGIEDIKTLENMEVSAQNIQDVSALAKSTVSSLTIGSIYNTEAFNTECWSNLGQADNIENVYIPYFYGENIDFLKGAHNLKSLTINECTKLTDISAIGQCPTLKTLILENCTMLTDISPVAGVTALEEIQLTWASSLSDIHALSALKQLKSIEINGSQIPYYCDWASLYWLVDFPDLESVFISGEAIPFYESLFMSEREYEEYLANWETQSMRFDSGTLQRFRQKKLLYPKFASLSYEEMINEYRKLRGEYSYDDDWGDSDSISKDEYYKDMYKDQTTGLMLFSKAGEAVEKVDPQTGLIYRFVKEKYDEEEYDEYDEYGERAEGIHVYYLNPFATLEDVEEREDCRSLDDYADGTDEEGEEYFYSTFNFAVLANEIYNFDFIYSTIRELKKEWGIQGSDDSSYRFMGEIFLNIAPNTSTGKIDKTDKHAPLYTVSVTAPDGYVNLREGAGTEFDIIMEIDNGEMLPVYEENGSWLYTEFGQNSGWVAASQVTREAQGTSDSKVKMIFPDSSREVLYEDVIEDLSDEELRLAINELYARHGYIFKDETLREYFKQFDWYEEKINSDDFSIDVFNEIERENIDLLKEERESKSE